MLYPPGVYRAEGDTALLADVMRRGGFARDRDVLDVGRGGALAVAAAQGGGRRPARTGHRAARGPTPRRGGR